MSKFSIVERTWSCCDTAASELRVSRMVPRIAMATSAAMTNTRPTTQPQLRRFFGGFGASPRGGITCGATAF